VWNVRLHIDGEPGLNEAELDTLVSMATHNTLQAVRFCPKFTKSTAPVRHLLKSTFVVWDHKCGVFLALYYTREIFWLAVQ
jgi:hypothetical protein